MWHWNFSHNLGYQDKISLGIGCDTNAHAVATANAAEARVGNAALEFRHINSLDDVPPGPFYVVTMIDFMHHIPPQNQYRAFCIATERVAHGGLLLYKDMAEKLFGGIL